MDKPNSMKSATKTMSTAPKRLSPHSSAILLATNMHTIAMASTMADIFNLKKNTVLSFREKLSSKLRALLALKDYF